jgi:phosphoglycerol transferase
MVLAFAVAAVVLELWQANPRVPIFPVGGDTDLTLASIKGVIEHGWYESNASLAAPFGQVNHDFPLYIGELGSVLEIKGLSLLFAHVAVIMNAFVMLGFPLAALSAYLVLRALGLERPVSLMCAVLFAVAPFHFVRAQAHLFLANYYAVPIGAYLILCALGWAPLFERASAHGGWRRWLSRRTKGTLALCLIVGIGGLYYAAFTCLLVASGALVNAVASRRWQRLVPGAVVIVAIGVPLALTAAPEILYRQAHGANPIVGQRAPFESLRLGLPPIQLVLPIPGNRIPALASLRADYEKSAAVPGVQGALPSDSLGFFGSVGLIWLLIGLLAGALGGGRRERLAKHTGVAALLAVALGATAGGGALFAYLVTPQIRAWDRIAILVAFFAVVGVGLLLRHGIETLARRGVGQWLRRLVLLATLILAVLDGTSSSFVPHYAAQSAAWSADAGFVGTIQETLPHGSMILELPYVSYPESLGPGTLDSYSLLEPYLHSTTLRWSAAAMAGRSTDWLAAASSEPLPQLIEGSVAAGFTGLYVDRRGYPDHAAALAAKVTALTGAQPIAGPDGKALFFDLAPYAAHLRAGRSPRALAVLGDLTTHPMFFGAGFYQAESGGGHILHWARAHAELQLTSSLAVSVRLSALLARTVPGTWRVRVIGPGGRSVIVPVSTAGTPIGLELILRPGTNTVSFDTNAPRVPGVPRDLHLEVLDAKLTAVGFDGSTGNGVP